MGAETESQFARRVAECLYATGTMPAGTEIELQDAIADRFASAGIEFSREHILSPEDRPDFLVGDVAVEVKIKGGLSAITRQLLDYAQHDCVGALVLVTSRSQLSAVPRELNGKPVSVVIVWSGL